MEQGLVTSGKGIRNKGAIPTLAIIQGIAAIGGMMIKGINALVDAKRASSFNNVMIWKRSYGYQIFYYICQICCLRLGLRSSGFTHD